jgi:membrane protein required for beta-lactamase induction
MVAVFSVIVVLAGTVFGLALLLTWLNVKYDDLTGRPVVARQTSPWLRSMRDERDDATQRKYGIGGIERVVIICAVAGILAFEAWFFFFAGSSLPNG